MSSVSWIYIHEFPQHLMIYFAIQYVNITRFYQKGKK